MANRSKIEDKSMDQINSSILNTYDLTGIEEMDPSLGTHIFRPLELKFTFWLPSGEGFKVVYDREIPLELRYVHLNSFRI